MFQAVAFIGSRALHALFHPAGFFISLLLMSLPAVAGQATLAWNPVVNSALAGYVLHYGPAAGQYTAKIDVGKATSRTVLSLTEGATYHFAVTAYDASRVESGFSNTVSATIPYGAVVAGFTASTTSGTAPLAMNFADASTGSISTYSWSFGDGTTSTSKSPSHVYAAPGVYSVSHTVTGPAGSNTKTIPNYVTVKAQGTVDTSPPTAPTSLVASASGSTSVQVAWKASTDNVGVTGYRIERCQGIGCAAFAQIATATGTTFSNSGLLAGTRYSYRVRAVDAAGRLSGYSNTATATTITTTADASPPTAPASLVASANGSTSIQVSWKASTDNVRVSGYRVERCQGIGCTAFTHVATATGTAFTNGGLVAGTRYSYRVRAMDGANLSAYSNTATATTSTQ